jgi:hypothetical protein
MTRAIISLIMLYVGMMASAQSFDSKTSLSRIAVVYYEKDGDGFFHRKENVNMNRVTDITNAYGYNKKSQELYCLTNNANYIITLNDVLAKVYKKSNSIPQVKDKEVAALIEEKNAELAEKYERINAARLKSIEDSIAKAKEDSIKKAQDDSIKRERQKQIDASYIASHKWYMVPTNSCRLYCPICEETISTKDSMICYAIKNDSIFYAELKTGTFANTYITGHAAKLTDEIKSSYNFQYHTSLFADSLENRFPYMNEAYLAVRNYLNFKDYLEEVRKEAPRGYFNDWNWDHEYSSITFDFRYTNTNKKTIKYIEVFWVCTNDVGDVRKTGSFRGTGPLAEWETASWNWDHSSYYVAGDASKMKLSKVLITYMDGTKATIPRDKICYEY